MTSEDTMGSRWTTAITYRTELGPRTITHDVEDLGEVVQLVERGPDWNTIVDIKVTLTRRRAGDDWRAIEMIRNERRRADNDPRQIAVDRDGDGPA